MILLGCTWADAHADLYVAGTNTTDYSVGLRWVASTPGSDGSQITGYAIQYGYSNGQYCASLEAGNVTNVSLAGFTTNVVYYFAVVAHADNGLDSLPSNEVSYSVPVAATPTAGPA